MTTEEMTSSAAMIEAYGVQSPMHMSANVVLRLAEKFFSSDICKIKRSIENNLHYMMDGNTMNNKRFTDLNDSGNENLSS